MREIFVFERKIDLNFILSFMLNNDLKEMRNLTIILKRNDNEILLFTDVVVNRCLSAMLTDIVEFPSFKKEFISNDEAEEIMSYTHVSVLSNNAKFFSPRRISAS